MQVSVENTGPLERRMRVEVPEEKIANEVVNRLQSLSRTTRIQGFRPGKAPFKVVQRRFGTKVRQEVIGEVVQTSFYEALAREKLRPASRPTIDPMDAEQGHGLVYTATFEVYPEVNLAPIEKLKLEKAVCQISDDDVEKMIEVIRKQQRSLQAVKRKASEGDVLIIDFKGSVDGEAFAGGEARDFQVELGSKRLIAGFEDGLSGAKAGEELTLNLNFPDEYHKRELAGKPVKFLVVVKAVNEQVLPELDEKLFSSMGVNAGGLDEFKAQVRRNMEREAEMAVANKTRNNILDALYAANKIELPKTLINNEAMHLHEQFSASLQMRGINVDNLPVKDTTAFNEQAEKKVTLQLIIADIVKTNQIKTDPATVRNMIEKIAQSYEDPNEVIKWYNSDQNRLAEVEALALEDEVVKWILSRAKVKEQKLTFDALMNKGQTE
ncbi:MAG: peptidyl-prolyl cis-trans isomerase [Gammaproteobacteria bacterium]|nr:peptidyl-prolyl cis-trans isomerase [Gammaproteobacteria bacterium]